MTPYEILQRHASTVLMEGLIKMILNPFFMKLLPAGEFTALKEAVAREESDRTQDKISNYSPKTQYLELCKLFGEDGTKAIGKESMGTIEQSFVPPLETRAMVQIVGKAVMEDDLPVFDKYNFPLRKNVDGTWTIELNDPRIRDTANLATRATFRTAGELNCYEETDIIQYITMTLTPGEKVWVHNITQNKKIGLGTTLERFNEWFKVTSIKLAEK